MSGYRGGGEQGNGTESGHKQSRLSFRGRPFGVRGLDGTSPVERLVLRTPTAYRRRLLAVAAIAILAFAAASGFLAWRQYRSNEHRAVNDLNARVVLFGALVDSTVAGGISTLQATAAAPVVMGGGAGVMAPYLKRVNTGGGKLFTAGMAWIDTSGQLRASSNGTKPIDVSDRDYFKKVMATRQPYVSPGLIGKRRNEPVVVVAVPTFNAQGALSGILSGGILLPTTTQTPSPQSQQQTAALGFTGLTVIDRDGQLITDRLKRVDNKDVVARMDKASSGDLEGSPGLEGGSDHVIAFATAGTLGWKIAIDRSESSVYSAARRSLLVDLGSIALAVVVALVILGLLARRSRRELEERGGHASSWSRLTRALGEAVRPPEVADALLDSVQEIFGDAVVVIAVESETGQEIRATSGLPGWRRVPGDTDRIRSIAELARDGPRTVSLERSRYRELYIGFGGRLKAVHAIPIVDSDGEPSSGIALLTARARLAANEWELLGAFATQAARALDRTRTFEHEHELAVRLQRSLLPADLPRVPGITLAGEYRAGGEGIEVGGDWYDAVLRPDGMLELCVGDVSGRGVGAATIMGRQRSTFRAYAYDCESPADIIRRMIRHVNEDEMITTVCITVDPLEGVLTYASAGHPPPLLLDKESGKVIRLDDASSPPLGVAEPGDVVEKRIPLPAHASLALYTDGLVERRGESIEIGIDALAQTIAETPSISAESALNAVAEAIGASSDDVALLIASFEPAPAFELELPAEPEILPGLRRRLRAWLGHQGFEDSEREIVLAVSEALNNAIEHAYRGAGGTIRLAMSIEAGRLRIEVADRGTWIPERAPEDRGRGLMLMRSLMDDVQIDTNGDGTRVMLERRERPEAAAMSIS